MDIDKVDVEHTDRIATAEDGAHVMRVMHVLEHYGQVGLTVPQRRVHALLAAVGPRPAAGFRRRTFGVSRSIPCFHRNPSCMCYRCRPARRARWKIASRVLSLPRCSTARSGVGWFGSITSMSKPDNTNRLTIEATRPGQIRMNGTTRTIITAVSTRRNSNKHRLINGLLTIKKIA